MLRYCLPLLLAGTTLAAEPPRARPPEFTDADRAPFFDNAFDTLVGERPVGGKRDKAAGPGRPETPGVPGASSSEWADLIAGDVLESEIKRQASALAKTTRSASAYKAGGYRDAVDALGVIATMFGVVVEHTGEPRWRDEAAALRDLFGGSVDAADGATDKAHGVAADRAADLTDLVRGGRPDMPEPAEEVDWGLLASRSTLMRRMGAAEEERLRGWLGSERAFRRDVEEVRHEAQVLAALADAIVRPEADEHDDPDYAAFARQLRDASAELARAAEDEEYEAAAAAMTAVSRSCVDCHADYRG